LLADARTHLEARLNAERDLRSTAQANLERAAGTDEADVLRRICALLDECFERHQRLHRPLIDAWEVFRREQERQRFAPVPIAPLPALEQELLVPTMALVAHDAAEVTEAFALAAMPPRVPLLLDLARLWDVLLRPRRKPAEAGPAPDHDELQPVPEPPPRFDEATRQLVDDRLAALGEPTPLSQLLAEMSPSSDGTATDLLVLRALQYFAPEVRTLPIDVVDSGVPLHHSDYHGDELLVVPLAPRDSDDGI
jgi:hypothetical protein